MWACSSSSSVCSSWALSDSADRLVVRLSNLFTTTCCKLRGQGPLPPIPTPLHCQMPSPPFVCTCNCANIGTELGLCKFSIHIVLLVCAIHLCANHMDSILGNMGDILIQQLLVLRLHHLRVRREGDQLISWKMNFKLVCSIVSAYYSNILYNLSWIVCPQWTCPAPPPTSTKLLSVTGTETEFTAPWPAVKNYSNHRY